jgi:rubrerythrin
VSKAVVDGSKKITSSIPERRPNAAERKKTRANAKKETGAALTMPVKLKYPVWRCVVCGYLAARDGPPGICPICKAGKERFERFL